MYRRKDDQERTVRPSFALHNRVESSISACNSCKSAMASSICRSDADRHTHTSGTSRADSRMTRLDRSNISKLRDSRVLSKAFFFFQGYSTRSETHLVLVCWFCLQKSYSRIKCLNDGLNCPNLVPFRDTMICLSSGLESRMV